MAKRKRKHPARKSPTGYGVTDVRIELTFTAPRDRVWKALTSGMSKWWPRDFFADPRAREMILELRPGGRMYEDWGGDAGALWFRVTLIDAPSKLELLGDLTPAWGGPVQSMVRIELSPEGRGTRFTLTDTLSGRIGTSKCDQTHEGWKQVFDVALRAYLEK